MNPPATSFRSTASTCDASAAFARLAIADPLRRPSTSTSTSSSCAVRVVAPPFSSFALVSRHQGAWALLHDLGLTARAPCAVQPAPPFGIPQIGSTTAWGGVWGGLLAAVVHRLEGTRLVVAATLFGLVLPTLAA